VRVLLISTYDLGRQPFGLASPAAWLRRAGADVSCVDASRDSLLDEQVTTAQLVAFHLPMHTATRLAAPLIDRVRSLNPRAAVAAYGLYAPLNASWLRERGVQHVLGPEAEPDLVALLASPALRGDGPEHTGPAPRPPSSREPRDGRDGRDDAVTRTARRVAHIAFIQPDRKGLPPLERYASLQMPDGRRRVVGSTEATRGCKHHCRHCPVVPVYRGTFRAIPADVVLEDIRAQVAAGAQHITFGDPDFFNGPTHARRIVERLARELSGVTYDVTIKIEHLLTHADLLSTLRETGCLFVTSAVESVDDRVLEKLQKGHTRADVVRAVGLCRAAGLTISPTFVPFTPWTTLEGYADLLQTIVSLDLVDNVAPIQLGIRLLVTAESGLLELPDICSAIDAFDPQSLTWPWRHTDSRVDGLQQQIVHIVAARAHEPRRAVFEAVAALAGIDAGGTPAGATASRCRETPPHLTESWYCCAEPLDHV
jgi:radical SAM superfamily enzyme YgiQ (UPF0313 family)